MGRGRFGLLVTLLAMAVAAVSFAAGLQVFDDGKADPPPSAGSSQTTGTTTAPVADSSATTVAPPPTVPAGPLGTPAWVTIVASEGSQAVAEQKAGALAAKGYPTGVLHSDDYKSLKAGLWVAYAGPYADARAAEAAVEQLAGDGVPGAYVRCVGSEKDCSDGQHQD
jgi:hypothetical protein